jgi:hypothetical protein
LAFSNVSVRSRCFRSLAAANLKACRAVI